VWSLARAHRPQGRQGRQGHQVGRTGLAGVADRHRHAAAGRTVVDRAVVDRTAGLGRSIAGAAQLVGRASGYDWRHSSDRIGRGGRRSLADAAELGHTDRAQVLGMDSLAEGKDCGPGCIDCVEAGRRPAPKGTVAVGCSRRRRSLAAVGVRRRSLGHGSAGRRSSRYSTWRICLE